jgi:hypothetical protein
MFKKYLLAAGLVVLTALALGACGNKGNQDEYADVTLRQATRGTVISKGFKYEFHNPTVVAVHNNIGIIREGNLLEFVGGRSLEDKLSGLQGKTFSMGVVKEFSPYVHFKVDQIYSETDTIFMPQTGAIDFPHVFTEDKFSHSSFEDYNLSRIPNRQAAIDKLVDSKFYVKAKIVQAEEDGSPVYMLIADENKFRIVDPADGTSAILQLLVKGNYPFEGGVTFSTAESFGSRQKSKIVGNVQVNFVKYGRMVIAG